MKNYDLKKCTSITESVSDPGKSINAKQLKL